MLLLLVRHGQAESIGPDGSDASRRLLPEGEAENRVCIQAVRRAGCRPDVIISSPLVRAAQTAQTAAEILDPPRGIREDERLVPGADLRHVRAIAADYDVDTLMLVGHNPDFSEIAGDLLGGAQVVLRTSGIACLRLRRVEFGQAELQWLIKPALFPRAGHAEDSTGNG